MPGEKEDLNRQRFSTWCHQRNRGCLPTFRDGDADDEDARWAYNFLKRQREQRRKNKTLNGYGKWLEVAFPGWFSKASPEEMMIHKALDFISWCEKWNWGNLPCGRPEDASEDYKMWYNFLANRRRAWGKNPHGSPDPVAKKILDTRFPGWLVGSAARSIHRVPRHFSG